MAGPRNDEDSGDSWRSLLSAGEFIKYEDTAGRLGDGSVIYYRAYEFGRYIYEAGCSSESLYCEAIVKQLG